MGTTTKDSDFIFDCIHSLYYKCHKINLNHGELCIDSPDWLKNKKTKINSANDDDKWFEYASAVAINHEEIGKNWQRISKIKPFTSKYNWKWINYRKSLRKTI